MSHSITCPECKRTISDHPLIESAAKLEDVGSQSLVCECGHRISIWVISAQLRKQETPAARLAGWFQGLGKK